MFQVDSRSRSCEKVKVKVIFDSLSAEICVCVFMKLGNFAQKLGFEPFLLYTVELVIYIIENYIDDITPHSSESPDTAMAPTPGHDVAPSSENVVMTSLPDNDFAPSTQASEPADNTYNTILNVTQKKRKKEKLKKTYMVPTWAATKSLLQSRQRVNHTNSKVVAPLFKTPPTDYATLYSVLTLTQEISAVVVGPERRTIITHHLYELDYQDPAISRE